MIVRDGRRRYAGFGYTPQSQSLVDESQIPTSFSVDQPVYGPEQPTSGSGSPGYGPTPSPQYDAQGDLISYRASPVYGPEQPTSGSGSPGYGPTPSPQYDAQGDLISYRASPSTSAAGGSATDWGEGIGSAIGSFFKIFTSSTNPPPQQYQQPPKPRVPTWVLPVAITAGAGVLLVALMSAGGRRSRG